MNCQKFEEVVSELARSQMMDADLRRESLDHASECQPCMGRLSDEENLSRGLDALKVEMRLVEAPSALEERLLSAFRAPQIAPPIIARGSHARYWLTAVAAVLLIVLGVVATRLRTEENKPPQQFKADNNKVQPQSSEPLAGATPEPEQTVPEKKVVTPKRRHSNYVAKNRSTRNQNAVANHAVSEVATEFMPLGYMSAANFQEGGQIVRVELPRAALANFGFPVNMDRYNEKVKADILLGADGLAHAIRFVQ